MVQRNIQILRLKPCKSLSCSLSLSVFYKEVGESEESKRFIEFISKTVAPSLLRMMTTAFSAAAD